MEIGKQFFVPPANQQSDIVFTAKLYRTETSPEVLETSSATLKATVMQDVAKMASVVKNLAFRPVNGMTVRLHLDTHALFQRQESLEDLSRAQRYERLSSTLLKKSVRGGGVRDSPSATPPSSPPPSPPSGGPFRGPASAPPSKTSLPTKPLPQPPQQQPQQQPAVTPVAVSVSSPVSGVVVRMLVAPGAGLLFGTPICEIVEENADEQPDEPAARSPSAPAPGGLYGSGPSGSNYGRTDLYRRNQYKRNSYSAAARYESSEVDQSSYGADSSMYEAHDLSPRTGGSPPAPTRSPPCTGTKHVVTWTKEEPAVVTRVHVDKDGRVSTGHPLVTVDTSRF